jgi:hypothetical protein
MNWMTDIPQAMESGVPLREFIVSPGFAGAAAVLAALIVLCAALYAGRRTGRRLSQELEQRDRHHREARDAEQHAAASQQAWETLKWLVKNAGLEPAASEAATLGLGPELAMTTLRGLLRDAERLGDETLAEAVTIYQSQFALILAQQGGPLSGLAASVPPASGPNLAPRVASETSTEEPAEDAEVAPEKPATPADETSTSTIEVAGGGRRRKQ